MTLWIFASSIIIVILIAHNVKRQKRSAQQADIEFWAREQKANSTRKKNLDGLKYITIPLETFPTHVLQQDSVAMECIETLEALTSRKIVNLTGFTNTDLKLEYGTANITPLSEYDQNYTVMVRTLQKWADRLIETGHDDDAAVLMEFAVDTGSDIIHTYDCLAGYYASRGDFDKIRRLKGLAGNLRSSSGKIILRHLNREFP